MHIIVVTVIVIVDIIISIITEHIFIFNSRIDSCEAVVVIIIRPKCR